MTQDTDNSEKEAIERLDEKLNYTNSLLKSETSLKGDKPSRTKRRVTPKAAYKYPLVEVRWDDAETSDGWEEPTTDLNAAIATTVGFLVRETDKHLLIASTYDEKHTNGRIQIPIGMVVSRKVIM